MSTPVACVSALPAPTALRVRFFLTSRGNRFMVELAEMFAEGFTRLGVPAEIELDRLPAASSAEAELCIVVAPHEYFPLFAVPQVGRRWADLAAGTWCLATEQPGSRCFEVGFRYAARCRGVFDINALGAAEFRRRGIGATFVPLGYSSSAEATERCGGLRDIDVLFLGHHSPKRARFLARHADRLARYHCHLVLNDPQQPRQEWTPGYVSGSARNRLLSQARVLLNVHSANRHYFEWQRAIAAMANGCVVVSEASAGIEPLCDGQHLIFAPVDDLMDRCEELLNDEPRRRRIAEAAYRFLRDERPIEIGCQQMLQAHWLTVCPRPAGRRCSPRTSAIKKAVAWVRWAWFGITSAADSLGPALRRSAWAHTLYYPAKSLAERLAGRWSLRQIEARRQAIVARLKAEAAAGLGPWSANLAMLANRRYEALGAPDVSVVVTVYQYAQYLEECLESVARAELAGLDRGIETIVVDDASWDASAEVAARWIRRDAVAACLVRKPTNTGLADSRNLGIRLARAPRVFILDADNRVYPQCLAKLVRAMDQSQADAAYGIIRRFHDATGKPLDLTSWYAWDVARLVCSPYLDAMALFDRARLLELGGYSRELVQYGWFGWEDYDLWLKLAQRGARVAFCPEIVAEYRVHGRSMIHVTSHYKPRLARYFRQKFADLAQRHPQTPRLFGWAR